METQIPAWVGIFVWLGLGVMAWAAVAFIAVIAFKV
jgi:hypothetical protein